MRETTKRVLTAVVAFVLFGAAGAFAWRALGPADDEATVPIAEPPPQVVVTLAESEEIENYPTGELTFGDVTIDAAIGSFGWCDDDGSCGIADTEIPTFDDYVAIPVGTALIVQTAAVRVDASIGDANYPFGDAVPIELSNGVGMLDADLGRHGLVFEVRWEEGESYLEAPLYFGIELVDPDAAPPVSEEPTALYETDTTVLESREHGPELCLGGVAESYPPQCGGVPIANWDWDLVEGEETASGTTWGSFHVVGGYDGATFTMTSVEPHRQPTPEEGDPFAAPCPEPEGGWTAPDPNRATEADRDAATRAAQNEGDSAGVWVDYLVEPADYEVPAAPDALILVAAFTGDLERHEADLRALWGGPLCVTQHRRTLDELMRIQRDLGADGTAEVGLQMTWSSVNLMENEVELGVVVADDDARAAVAARYGAGAIELIPALTPSASSHVDRDL
jgi:hypothetical protein